MASNAIPQYSIERIFALAEDMADGAQAHEAAIGLQQNTEAALRADLAAAHAAENAFQAARSNKAALSAAQTVADSNAKAHIAAVKNVLMLSLGNSWNAQWAAAGWNDPTLKVPAGVADRLGLLPSIQAYFTANPAKENAALGVTAANAQARYTALSDARSAVHAGNTSAGTAKAARGLAVEKLRQRMIGLVRELTQLIPGDDPRWYAFGLNRPDDPATPARPEALVLTGGGPGIILVDWPDARRAERYKVQRQIVGTDLDFVQAADVEDSDATISGLPAGATVKVRVIAANAAGDSQPSEEAQIVVT